MAAPSTPASMIRCTTGMFFGPSSRAIASERRTRPQVSTRLQIAISVAAGKTIHDTNIGTSSGPTCTGHCFSARVAVDNQRRSAGASKALPVVVNLAAFAGASASLRHLRFAVTSVPIRSGSPNEGNRCVDFSWHSPCRRSLSPPRPSQNMAALRMSRGLAAVTCSGIAAP